MKGFRKVNGANWLNGGNQYAGIYVNGVEISKRLINDSKLPEHLDKVAPILLGNHHAKS